METLVWREIDEWWPVVLDALSTVRHRDRIMAVRRQHAIEAIVAQVRDRFVDVRLFHGCRPVDVSVYYRDGLRRHGPFILDRAREIFRAQGVLNEDIEAAIAETDLEVDQERVFLALDEEQLLETAGHYLIYGSEAVMSVAATLMRKGYHNAQSRLTRIGQPTLLTCDVPLSLLKEYSVREIAESLYEAYRVARGRQPRRPAPRDHTVVVHQDIPASAVRSHRTPSEIRDWHRFPMLARGSPW